MELLAAQCRAARALLNWSQGELGQRARVDQRTITNFERGVSTPHPRTIEALLKVLEVAGVEFLDPIEGVGGSGVRFKWGVELSQRPASGEGGASEGISGDGSISAAPAAWDEG